MSTRRRTKQLALDLRSASRWGGRREGAGRKPGRVRRDLHRARAALAARHPCHVTLRVRVRLPSLRTRCFLRELEPSLRGGCERSGFRVVHYSVQANHAHFIVEASSAHALSCGLRSLCARFARAANRAFRRAGTVLADRSHVRVLRTPREVRHAIAYVLLNARRHAAQDGRVTRRAAAPDPASSGRWFDGWMLRVGRPSDPPAVAKPRTWLLANGWRRWGRIAFDEIPGA
jgi:REP element-mobilizing transposase RayT